MMLQREERISKEQEWREEKLKIEKEETEYRRRIEKEEKLERMRMIREEREDRLRSNAIMLRYFTNYICSITFCLGCRFCPK